MTEPLLSVKAILLRRDAAAFDFAIAPGEIVGLAGLDGHGQERFLEILAGVSGPVAGSVSVGSGHSISSLREAIRNGVVYLPRDRRATGLFSSMSIIDNFAIATVGRDARLGLIDTGRRRARYEAYKKQLSIVAERPSNAITTLSGGNQQKVLLARALAHDPRVLLLNDPTRGVDIATRRVLYDVFRDLAAKGMALVVLSSEIEEVLGLCGRLHVFRDFTVSASLAGDAMTTDAVITAMFGRAA
ncbi:MAG: ATP-binding cassette domain-containing protein [Mesorhizobium sp.]